MLTESCVMFFSPSRAVLSAILQDEYLTSRLELKKEKYPRTLILELLTPTESRHTTCLLGGC